MKKQYIFTLFIVFIINLTACMPVRYHNPGYGNPAVTDPDIQPPVRLNSQIKASKKDLILLKSWPDAADNKRKVKVCLINNTAKGKWKAMYYKHAKPPKKFQAKGKNSYSCAHYSAGYKTFYFWKRGLLGKKKMLHSYSIDLSRYAGHHVNFEWIRD